MGLAAGVALVAMIALLIGSKIRKSAAAPDAGAVKLPSIVLVPAKQREILLGPPEPTGTLRIDGQVVDEDGMRPVPGALVHIDTQPASEVKAEGDGSFYFEGLLPREYHLSARADARSAGPISVRATPPASHAEPVVLRLGAGSRLEVEVTTASDHRPISGASIVVTSDQTIQQGRTGDDGRLTLSGLGPGGYQISASAQRLSTEWREIQVASTGWMRVRLELSPGASISGRVVDGAGKPVEGAAVALEDSRSPFAPHNLAVSGPSGEWEFPTVSAGNYRFWSWPVGNINADVARGSSPLVRHDGIHTADNIEIRLPSGFLINGRVVYADSRVAPFARIRIRAAHGLAFGDLDVRTTYAGPKGEFSFVGLPAGETVAVADLEDLVSKPLRVSLKESTSAELILEASEGISGVVVDPAGEPVPESQVIARSTDGTSASAVLAAATDITDATGHFHLRGLVVGSYSLRALPVGSRPGNQWDQPGTQAKVGDRDVKLTISRGGRLVGKVTTTSGQPVKGFSIGLGVRLPKAFTADNGAFVIDDLRAGTWSVLVSGPGFARLTIPDIVIVGGKVTDMGTVTVAGGRTISGLVVDSKGSPQPGVSVVVGNEIQGTGGTLDTPIAYRLGMAVVQSDESGHFSLIGQSIGQLLVIANKAGLGRSRPTAIPSGSTDVEISLTLGAPGRIGGATRNGTASAPALVQATSLTVKNFLLSTSSGTDGRYEFTQMAPDEYLLTASFGSSGAFDTASSTPSSCITPTMFPEKESARGNTSARRFSFPRRCEA